MPLGALGLVLGAAVLHALWNLLLAGARDAQTATAAALTTAVVVLAPVALVVGGIPTRSLPWIAASAVLELAYFALLATAYQVGELSVTYPLARGLAPVFLVAVGATTGVGGAVGAIQVLGVVVVAAGIVVAALSIFGAYVLVLAALKLASAASVGAVRECSVVIVTAFAAAFLHERVGVARWAGAMLVTTGIVAIALG